MFNLAKKTSTTPGTAIKTKNKVITYWAPAGRNTAYSSLQLATELSNHTSVLLAELPCLAIPRLAFEIDIKDRDLNIDNLILDLDRKGDFSLAAAQAVTNNLSLLFANPMTTPDYPVTVKVELRTLIDFPVKLINKARQSGFGTIIYDCQGQLTTPLTFFAISNSDIVLIPVDEPNEIAFALQNIKRLLQVFDMPATKFKILTHKSIAEIAQAMTIKNDDGEVITTIETIADNLKEVLQVVTRDAEVTDEPVAKKDTGKKLGFFARDTKNKEKPKAQEVEEDSTPRISI